MFIIYVIMRLNSVSSSPPAQRKEKEEEEKERQEEGRWQGGQGAQKPQKETEAGVFRGRIPTGPEQGFHYDYRKN